MRNYKFHDPPSQGEISFRALESLGDLLLWYTLIAIVLRDYNAAFLSYYWFLLFYDGPLDMQI